MTIDIEVSVIQYIYIIEQTHYSSYFIIKTCKWDENHKNKTIEMFLDYL